MKISESIANKIKITFRLIKLILKMNTDQQLWLLKTLGTFEDFDARKSIRKACSISVYYAVGDRYFKDTIHNVSIGGVFIETDKSFGVGQEILLTFSLPEYESPFSLVGEVAWIGVGGIGVKFKNLTPDQVKILNLVIQV
jgi:hypothetical protein